MRFLWRNFKLTSEQHIGGVSCSIFFLSRCKNNNSDDNMIRFPLTRVCKIRTTRDFRTCLYKGLGISRDLFTLYVLFFFLILCKIIKYWNTLCMMNHKTLIEIYLLYVWDHYFYCYTDTKLHIRIYLLRVFFYITLHFSAILTHFSFTHKRKCRGKCLNSQKRKAKNYHPSMLLSKDLFAYLIFNRKS